MSDMRPGLLYCAPRVGLLLAAAVFVLGESVSPAWGETDQTGSPTTQPSTKPAVTSQPATTSAPAPRSKLRLLDGSDASGGLLGGSGGVLWQMLAYVLVILVVGVIAAFVMKRVMPRITAGGGREMALVESLHLGPRKSVHLLRVGDRRFLVTAARDRMSSPTEVTSAFDDILNSRTPPDGQEGDVRQ